MKSGEVLPGEIVLAERGGWRVVADTETVYVLNLSGHRWEVGWMYGHPCGALITADETHAVIVGCGALVADLTCFGEEVAPGETWAQTPVVHLLASPGEHWFFEGVYEGQTPGAVQLVADLAGEQAGIYELVLPTLALVPRWAG
ncbi:hypothetical protein [Deinococcus wulumuqiensis]|uniref:DUF4178 domain-containing protein n=1 Tax=Deinococcus wulumuqiensis TaxID=980427 RepID=A0AAV4JZT0_9DEIO|nr:hypothetical protein [Deinococcus wulumuqiensis]QII19782.1 hypothetical protein G6R31_02710 [Deinococcus wulumuqiensis R12]GGI71715.1 hypothetical protein GCM10010914_02230 [Deinococcus wulumuqiensis]GGP28385.1 hypothetical protein GCM10008021_00360 [Deinococcus wulumuqiensis]